MESLKNFSETNLNFTYKVVCPMSMLFPSHISMPQNLGSFPCNIYNSQNSNYGIIKNACKGDNIHKFPDVHCLLRIFQGMVHSQESTLLLIPFLWF